MKLRLPNKLVAAIMATASPVLFQTLSTATVGAVAFGLCASNASANQWGLDGSYMGSYYFNQNGTVEAITTADSTATNNFIRAGEGGTREATVNTLTMTSGHSLTVADWGGGQFSPLTIDRLVVEEGAVGFSINDGQTVKLKQIEGVLPTVTNSGNLTLGSLAPTSDLTLNGAGTYTIEHLTLEGVTVAWHKGGNTSNVMTVSDLTVSGNTALGTNISSTCWNGAFNIGALQGQANSKLTLFSGSQVVNNTVFHLNGGEGSNFSGALELSMKNTSSAATRRVVADINADAASLFSNSVVSLSSENTNSTVGLGINASKVTLKGLQTQGTNGTAYIFSGAAGTNAQEYDSDSTKRTLVIGNGTQATESYTFAGKVKSNLNIEKVGAGTQIFSGDVSAINGTIKVSGGKLEFSGTQAITGADSFSFDGTNSTLVFNQAVTFQNNNYSSFSGAGNVVEFNRGFNYTGTGGQYHYALLVGNGAKAYFGGTTDVSQKMLGIAAGSEIIVKDGASLTAAGVYNSSNINSDGNLTIGEGATLKTTTNGVITQKLTNSGTLIVHGTNSNIRQLVNATDSARIEVVGESSTSLGKLELSSGSDLGAVNLGHVVLNNAEFYNSSNFEGASRSFETLAIKGNAKLTQNSWNTHWHINHITNAEGATPGEGVLEWYVDTNHFSNSVLYLDGDSAGDFDGTLKLTRALKDGNTGNGAYQAYAQINNGVAVQDAIVDVNGVDSSHYMSLALNAGTVKMSGLTGTEYGIVYAGTARADVRAGGSKKPSSTGTSTLALNVKEGKELSYAGEILAGVSIKKEGAGKQTFAGNVNAFNGTLAVADGGKLSFTGLSSDTTTNNLHIFSSATVSATEGDSGALQAGAATLTAQELTEGSLTNATFTADSLTGKLNGTDNGTLVNALLTLQENTTYSISDMDLQNSYIHAEAATKLALQNINVNGVSGVSAVAGSTLSGQNYLTLSDDSTVIEPNTNITTDQLSGLTLQSADGNSLSLTLKNSVSDTLTNGAGFSITLSNFKWQDLIGESGTVQEFAITDQGRLNEVFKVTALGSGAPTSIRVVNAQMVGQNLQLDVVPEPTTGALSLLALTALAARRRRK